MEKRVWVRSGVVEELDARQSRLIHLVLEKIHLYYRESASHTALLPLSSESFPVDEAL